MFEPCTPLDASCDREPLRIPPRPNSLHEMPHADRDSVYVEITDSSAVSYARRVAADLLAATGAGPDDVSAAELVVTELGTNLVRHAVEGAVHLVPDPIHRALDVVTTDKGPGFEITIASVDGFSTKGGPGLGLGTVSRNSSVFKTHSDKRGSIVHARIGTAPEDDRCHFATLGLNAWREERSGDARLIHQSGNRLTMILVDALGHGAAAAVEARAVMGHTRRQIERDGALSLVAVQTALETTRGSVVASFDYDRDTGKAVFCGAGNIAAHCISPSAVERIPFPGGVFGRGAKPSETIWHVDVPTRVVMHTDGIDRAWARLEWLRQAWSSRTLTPLMFAAALLRDFRNIRDDSLIVIVDLPPAGVDV